MRAIVLKEINSFFSLTSGYLVIAVFLTVNGLFLWVFNGSYNVFDAGFADLSAFFQLAPWILLLLIPAVTMRSFSDEKKLGTLELLVTKPLSIVQIIIGKYIGALLLLCMAIIPTLTYVFTIDELGNPPGNWDTGVITGSYLGLFFLMTSFTSMGIFCSVLTENQMVAFISTIFLCFILFYGFEGLANYSWFGNFDYYIAQLSMHEHYNNISRGVIDTRDVLYFLSISMFFLMLTRFSIPIK